MTSLSQPRPRCFYCDTALTDEQARISLPDGKIYGPCCEDIARGEDRKGHR